MNPSISKPAVVTAFGIAAVLSISLAAIPVLAQVKEAAEIEGVTQQYREAWQRGDLDRVMQFWRMFTPPGTRSQGLSNCWYREFSL
jgi:hypothetical protein